jgi:hypothetical protein
LGGESYHAAALEGLVGFGATVSAYRSPSQGRLHVLAKHLKRKLSSRRRQQSCKGETCVRKNEVFEGLLEHEPPAPDEVT